MKPENYFKTKVNEKKLFNNILRTLFDKTKKYVVPLDESRRKYLEENKIYQRYESMGIKYKNFPGYHILWRE